MTITIIIIIIIIMWWKDLSSLRYHLTFERELQRLVVSNQFIFYRYSENMIMYGEHYDNAGTLEDNQRSAYLWQVS